MRPLSLSRRLAVGAAWPWFAAHRAQASAAAPAPISPIIQRNASIAFYEAQASNDPDDQITRRVLGAEYLRVFARPATSTT